MIIKRKLFSFIDEDGNLVYYLYNESTGEEKLFSVVEEEKLYFNLGTRLKRVGQKYIGRARKSIATRLENSATENFAKAGKHGEAYLRTNNGTLRDAPELAKHYMKEVHSLGGRVMRSNTISMSGSYVSHAQIPYKKQIAKELIKSGDPNNAKLGRHFLNPKKTFIITLNHKVDVLGIPEAGIGDLAHEMGHLRGKMSRSKARKAISDKANRDAVSFIQRHTRNITTNNPISVGYDGAARLLEEKLATRSALRDLKRYNVSPELIQSTKERLGHGYKSYLESIKGQIKDTAGNLVQIPSRRRPLS